MLIKTRQDIIQSYLDDASGLLGGNAQAVVIPADSEEVAKFLAESSAKRTPVTVSGGGTGVTGGRVPFGGTVLSLEALNRIIEIREISAAGAIAIVQPAVTVAALKKAAAERNFMYAPDPTEQTSFVGGNVATNASGSRGFKFGPTRKYVNRLTVILSSGRRLDIKRGHIFADAAGTLSIPAEGETISFALPDYTLPKIKNATGYYNEPGMDLIDLFIGQEGTLGVITEIEVRLIPMIKKTLGGIVFFPAEELSWDFAETARQHRAETNLLSLEYFDSHALFLLKNDYPAIPSFAKAAIFFEQDISEKNETAELERWAKIFTEHHAPIDNAWLSTAITDQETFREFRHRLPERVNEVIRKNRFPKVGTDIAVPPQHSRAMMEFYRRTLEQLAIPHLIFGHIGESHMHANILPATEEEFKRGKEAYLTLIGQAIRFGGTVSAEHGIGKIKHSFIEKMLGENGMKEMARIKRALDPACILNRGNIFPERLLNVFEK